MNSLKAFSAIALVLLALTVLLLPLSTGSKITIFMVIACVGIFAFVEGSGKTKTFAGIVIALLVLYLGVTAQRGVLLMMSGSAVGVVLGVSLLVLPIVGAWAMIREIIFGARIQSMADAMAQAGELPQDNYQRTAAGRISRTDADAQFATFQRAVEQNPERWQNWFNLSLAYDASGDRKRARSAMRDAITLRAGKIPVHLSTN